METASACLRVVHELASVSLRDAYPTPVPPPPHSGVLVRLVTDCHCVNLSRDAVHDSAI